MNRDKKLSSYIDQFLNRNSNGVISSSIFVQPLEVSKRSPLKKKDVTIWHDLETETDNTPFGGGGGVKMSYRLEIVYTE